MTAIRLVFPWAVCCPDNRRVGLLGGRALLTTRYRRAKEAATMLVQAQRARASVPAGVPAQLRAVVYFPDARRRDLLNLAKLLHDACAAGGALADDAQLADVQYVRGGVDRAHPRVEITLTALTDGPLTPAAIVPPSPRRRPAA